MASVASSRMVADRNQGLFAQFGAALARRRLYSRTLTELRQLSDKELSDLGISRLSVVDVAREAVYGR